MRKLQLTIVPVINLITCQVCKVGVGRNAALTHAGNHVPTLGKKKDYESQWGTNFRNAGKIFERICASHGICIEGFPPIPESTIPPSVAAYTELQIHEVMVCSKCYYAAKTANTIAKHWSDKHRGDKSNKIRPGRHFAQCFSKTYFLVYKPQVEEQVTDTRQALQDFLKERQPMQSLRVTDKSVFLQEVGWDTFLDKWCQDKKEWSKLSRRLDETPVIREHVTEYLLSCGKGLAQKDGYVQKAFLFRLSNKQWAQSEDGGLNSRYALVVSKFLSEALTSLSSTEGSFRLPLSNTQKESAMKLSAALIRYI